MCHIRIRTRTTTWQRLRRQRHKQWVWWDRVQVLRPAPVRARASAAAVAAEFVHAASTVCALAAVTMVQMLAVKWIIWNACTTNECRFRYQYQSFRRRRKCIPKMKSSRPTQQVLKMQRTMITFDHSSFNWLIWGDPSVVNFLNLLNGIWKIHRRNVPFLFYILFLSVFLHDSQLYSRVECDLLFYLFNLHRHDSWCDLKIRRAWNSLNTKTIFIHHSAKHKTIDWKE